MGFSHLNRKIFKDAEVEVYFQEYNHPSYNQCYGKFKPYMSILDLMFNEGPNSLNIIRSGRNYIK